MELRTSVRWAVTALLGLVAAGALYLGYRQYSQLQPRDSAFGAPAAAATLPPPAAAPELAVHVSGAVKSPGVHRLPAGARVAEAVAAAEPLAEAVPDALNLAAPLADGDKVFVPTRADLPQAAGAPGALGANHGPVAAPQGAQGTAAVKKVNLNTADQKELMSVPGIGGYLADKILAHRKAVGRFRRIEDLLNVPGVGEATLNRIRPYVSV